MTPFSRQAVKTIALCLLLSGRAWPAEDTVRGAEVNLSEMAKVSASSQRGDYVPGHVTDGVVSDVSRWLAAEDDPAPWVELVFPEPTTVAMIDVFSGWRIQDGSPLESYDVTVEVDGAWQNAAHWQIRGNKKSANRICIDRERVSKMRLALTKPGAARIREIVVYDNKEAQGLKDVGVPGNAAEAYDIRLDQHQIAVNQIGYFTNRPKRFTAPLSADGTEFTIRAQDAAAVLYRGVINGGVGDFTAFRPANSDARYIIDLSGGTLKPNTSDPFLIREQLDQEQYLQFDKHASTPDMNGLLFNAGRYAFKVDPVGFRFSLEDNQGHTMVQPNNLHGLHLNGQPIVEIAKSDLALGEFVVRTADGQNAMVKVSLNGELVCLKVVPQNKGENEVSLSVSGMPLAHGLGDTGAWGPSFNLVRDKVHRYELKHDGGRQRWISSFVIFPQNDFAGVFFDAGDKAVTLGKDQYTMSLRKEGDMSFYYMLGDTKTIYKTYLSLRQKMAYPNIKPKFRLFELGWESWDALGYQTSAKTVRDMIATLLEEGYPIRWAVTGSGFWEDKGTTTSFGKFGPKFEDHRGFKAWLNDNDVKWMIGQRTNLVPSGGPYHTKAKNQDANSKTKVYNGNPASDEGLARGYFLKNEQGEVIEKASRWYPQIACYILDGRISKAAEWFVQSYQKWGVDGIKEDTMMDLGSHYDIYNGPSALIAQQGGLVMARCGSFSAPGTLLRINDTNGAASMQRRTPINYMQYAACGAPNVYSDTIGFHGISHVEATLRHGWMMATTAGLAIGKQPAKWDRQQQTMFKRMIDFHYQLGPYLYDAAIKSYHEGYPYTLTPISIAYPHDREAAQTTHYQWMMGESILAAPLVKGYKSGKLDVYLPEGTWFDYDTGRQYEGPLLLDEYEMPLDKTPCFIGGKGVVVLRESDDSPLKAKIYPIVKDQTAFTFHYPDGMAKTVIELSALNDKTVVIDATAGKTIRAAVEHQTGALSFSIYPGHNYKFK